MSREETCAGNHVSFSLSPCLFLSENVEGDSVIDELWGRKVTLEIYKSRKAELPFSFTRVNDTIYFSINRIYKVSYFFPRTFFYSFLHTLKVITSEKLCEKKLNCTLDNNRIKFVLYSQCIYPVYCHIYAAFHNSHEPFSEAVLKDNFTTISLRGIDSRAVLMPPKGAIIRWHMREFPRALQWRIAPTICRHLVSDVRLRDAVTERVPRSGNRNRYFSHIAGLCRNDGDHHVTIYMSDDVVPQRVRAGFSRFEIAD